MTTAVINTETELEIVTSDTNTDSIPQIDGPSESQTQDVKQVTVKNKEEPVVVRCKKTVMLREVILKKSCFLLDIVQKWP